MTDAHDKANEALHPAMSDRFTPMFAPGTLDTFFLSTHLICIRPGTPTRDKRSEMLIDGKLVGGMWCALFGVPRGFVLDAVSPHMCNGIVSSMRAVLQWYGPNKGEHVLMANDSLGISTRAIAVVSDYHAMYIDNLLLAVGVKA